MLFDHLQILLLLYYKLKNVYKVENVYLIKFSLFIAMYQL